jgi:hypothetical protein
MELLLSSRFAALIVAVVGNMNSWISGIFLRVTELLRTVQENSLVYSKQNKKYTVTRAIPGTEIYTLYWATPGTEVLYVFLRPLPGTEVSLWSWE